MSWLTITAYREADRGDVLDLWQRCFPDYPDAAAAQLDLALRQSNAAVFVARESGALAGTAMAGSDGIRGWLHYVAVAPARRRRGIGRALVRHAETWIAARGVSKIKLQVRDVDSRHVYVHLGYTTESHETMGKRIRPPHEQPVAEPRGGEPGCLDVVVTHLEMTSAPAMPGPKPPAMKLAVLKAEAITVPFYRFLYAETGREWVWYERRAMDDAALVAEIQHPEVDVFVLYVGGQPGGFLELDRRRHPAEIEIRYFGLMPGFIGRGLGRWFLDWSVREGWRHAPQRLYVNTCSLDHPKALALYQRAGFTPFRQETRAVRDPRPLA
ncbi:MAG: GNAT family N-acetyltransferase [Alphaproteobacteria bacterium]|nr:GNAT family N-acetyltransferase [Alphaproteobacteria bacterium]